MINFKENDSYPISLSVDLEITTYDTGYSWSLWFRGETCIAELMCDTLEEIKDTLQENGISEIEIEAAIKYLQEDE